MVMALSNVAVSGPCGVMHTCRLAPAIGTHVFPLTDHIDYYSVAHAHSNTFQQSQVRHTLKGAGMPFNHSAASLEG